MYRLIGLLPLFILVVIFANPEQENDHLVLRRLRRSPAFNFRWGYRRKDKKKPAPQSSNPAVKSAIRDTKKSVNSTTTLTTVSSISTTTEEVPGNYTETDTNSPFIPTTPIIQRITTTTELYDTDTPFPHGAQTPPPSGKKANPWMLKKGRRVDRLKKLKGSTQTTEIPLTFEVDGKKLADESLTIPDNDENDSNPGSNGKGKKADSEKKGRRFGKAKAVPATTEVSLTFDTDGKKLNDESLVIPDNEDDTSQGKTQSNKGGDKKSNPWMSKKGRRVDRLKMLLRTNPPSTTTEIPLTFDSDGKTLADESLIIPDDGENTNPPGGMSKGAGDKKMKSNSWMVKKGKRVDRLKMLRGTTEPPLTFDVDNKKLDDESLVIPDSKEDDGGSSGRKKHVEHNMNKGRGMEKMDKEGPGTSETKNQPKKKSKRIDRLKMLLGTTISSVTTEIPLTFDSDGKKLADESLVIPENDAEDGNSPGVGGRKDSSAGGNRKSNSGMIRKGKRVDRLKMLRGTTEIPLTFDLDGKKLEDESLTIPNSKEDDSTGSNTSVVKGSSNGRGEKSKKGRRIDRLKKLLGTILPSTTTEIPLTFESDGKKLADESLTIPDNDDSTPGKGTSSDMKKAKPMGRKGKRVDRLKMLRGTTEIPLTFDLDGKKLEDESLTIPNSKEDDSTGSNTSVVKGSSKGRGEKSKKGRRIDRLKKLLGTTLPSITTEIPLTFESDGKKLADESLTIPDNDDSTPGKGTSSDVKKATPMGRKGKRVDRLKKFSGINMSPATTDIPLTFDDDGTKLADESLVISDQEGKSKKSGISSKKQQSPKNKGRSFQRMDLTRVKDSSEDETEDTPSKQWGPINEFFK